MYTKFLASLNRVLLKFNSYIDTRLFFLCCLVVLTICSFSSSSSFSPPLDKGISFSFNVFLIWTIPFLCANASCLFL